MFIAFTCLKYIILVWKIRSIFCIKNLLICIVSTMFRFCCRQILSNIVKTIDIDWEFSLPPNSWMSNLFCLTILSWGSIFCWHSWCTMYLICTDSHQTFDDAIMDVARKVAKYKDTKSKQNGRLKKPTDSKFHWPRITIENTTRIFLKKQNWAKPFSSCATSKVETDLVLWCCQDRIDTAWSWLSQISFYIFVKLP